MQKIFGATLALGAALSLAACNTPQGQNAAGGALLGGAAGAIIGSAVTGGKPGGAIVGGVTGAAAGAMIGSASTPRYRGRCAEWRYDYYGRRYCAAFY